MFYQQYVIDQFCLIYDIDSSFIFDLIHQHKLILTKNGDDFFAGDVAKPNAFTWIVIGCFGIAGVEKFAKK